MEVNADSFLISIPPFDSQDGVHITHVYKIFVVSNFDVFLPSASGHSGVCMTV